MKTKTVIIALAALAHTSRLAIFRHLVQVGPAGSNAGDIAASLGIPAATLSFHAKEMSHADLIESEQEGRFVRYRANYTAMNSLIAYLTENCCGGQPDQCLPKAKKAKRKATSPARAGQ